MQIKELRLLNSKIFKEGNLIYEGKIDEAPEQIKLQDYTSISFEGTDVIIKI